MAESVDALVSNTSGAIRAGSTPALGTKEKTLGLRAFFLYRPSLVDGWEGEIAQVWSMDEKRRSPKFGRCMRWGDGDFYLFLSFFHRKICIIQFFFVTLCPNCVYVPVRIRRICLRALCTSARREFAVLTYTNSSEKNTIVFAEVYSLFQRKYRYK